LGILFVCTEKSNAKKKRPKGRINKGNWLEEEKKRKTRDGRDGICVKRTIQCNSKKNRGGTIVGGRSDNSRQFLQGGAILSFCGWMAQRGENARQDHGWEEKSKKEEKIGQKSLGRTGGENREGQH